MGFIWGKNSTGDVIQFSERVKGKSQNQIELQAGFGIKCVGTAKLMGLLYFD